MYRNVRRRLVVDESQTLAFFVLSRCSTLLLSLQKFICKKAIKKTLNNTQLDDWISRVVFEAEASGGSKAGGLPTFPRSLPSPFPFPISFQANQWEGRSDPVRGEVSRLPPLQIPPCEYREGVTIGNPAYCGLCINWYMCTGSNLTFSTNLFHHSLLAPTWTAFSDYTGPDLLCSTVFHF